MANNADFLKIENAILKLKDELKDHITNEVNEIQEVLNKHDKAIKKNENNLRTLVIVLVVTGVLGGGGVGYSISRLIIGGG